MTLCFSKRNVLFSLVDIHIYVLWQPQAVKGDVTVGEVAGASMSHLVLLILKLLFFLSICLHSPGDHITFHNHCFFLQRKGGNLCLRKSV